MAGALLLTGVLALAGCQGEKGPMGPAGIDGTDGVDGTDGATGPQGPEGPAGPGYVEPVTGRVAVGDEALAYVGNDVVVTYTVKVDGEPRGEFTNKYRAYQYVASATVPGAGSRTSIAVDAFTVVAGTGADLGEYTATFPGLAATLGTTPATLMLTVNTGQTDSPLATVVVNSPSGAPKSTVSDAACINCHGDTVFASSHKGANPKGVAACVVCHVVEDRASRGENGDRLKSYVHGIHNSYDMPARKITGTVVKPGETTKTTVKVDKPAGYYARNDALAWDAETGTAVLASPYKKVTFPSYMNNCSTCHDTDENLAAVLAKPVSFSTCMSCHDGWAGFGVANTGTAEAPIYSFNGIDHAKYTATTPCGACHEGTIAPAKVGDFHQGVQTERGGLLFAGKDQSVEQAKKITVAITGVTAAGAGQPMSFTWVASDPTTGAAYDPCNTDYAAGPVFFGGSANATTGALASNYSALLAFAQANDWVNAGIGSAPGQPGGATNLTGTNTTCTGNVATTTIAVPTAASNATKAIVAIQGRPQVLFAPANRVIFVRVPAPTREFMLASGAEPAADQKRRKIVDSQACIKCHLGSIYQHSGTGATRVDNVELCVMCHNPAANEQNNRATLGVNASNSYDGKNGETYDLRYMLHAIHSGGETGQNLVYYRGMGIYAWGDKAGLKNWPGEGTQVIAGTSVTRTHNYHFVKYPRPLTDCTACHINDSHKALPNPTKAVAVTTVAGASYSSQLDDVLMGSSAASCMSCHGSGDASIQAALRAHAAQNGWAPAVFPDGRQSILSGAAVESCVVCHGPGKSSDFNVKHGN